MTPEQQRIAIAEACGWVFDHKRKTGTAPKESNANSWDCFKNHPDFGVGTSCPDYLNDLNAMRDAEEVVFNKNSWTTYTDNLIEIVPKNQSPIRATAKQRAVAMLKTIKKWI